MRPPIQIKPRRPAAQVVHDAAGKLLGIRRSSASLAMRTVELINGDRVAAASPEAGQTFRR